ncbi:MAG: hypothetical protein JW717_05920 [Marinilabiliaceae bacterium]|nr:hypothetical protein [Marinilabiliaceae bacterium]
MEKVKTKHFQYTGTDDYDMSLDDQLNAYLDKEGISVDQIVDIKYAGHSANGVNNYSALLVYVE